MECSISEYPEVDKERWVVGDFRAASAAGDHEFVDLQELVQDFVELALGFAGQDDDGFAMRSRV
jgi:hypothetical protein